MNAERKFVDICTLAAEVEYTNFRIWHTTIEPGLRVRLYKSVEVLGIQGSFTGAKASAGIIFHP